MPDPSMTDQAPPLLFAGSTPYQRHSPTSRAAADKAANAADQEAMVMSVLMLAGDAGMTDEEIYVGLIERGDIGPEIKDSSIRRARIMLTHAGRVRAHDTRRRAGRSGRLMSVWLAAG